QQVLAPYGLRFGPDPSSANRCTIGGMIGNNAYGPHALSYGRTAANVVSMQLLTGTGKILCADSDTKSFNAVNGLEELVMGELALLRTEFVRFDSQISGYSFEHLLPEPQRNLTTALVGIVGILGIILEVTIRAVPKAAVPAPYVLGYSE